MPYLSHRTSLVTEYLLTLPLYQEGWGCGRTNQPDTRFCGYCGTVRIARSKRNVGNHWAARSFNFICAPLITLCLVTPCLVFLPLVWLPFVWYGDTTFFNKLFIAPAIAAPLNDAHYAKTNSHPINSINDDMSLNCSLSKYINPHESLKPTHNNTCRISYCRPFPQHLLKKLV